MTTEGTLLWEPTAERIARARITEFAAAVGRAGASYEQLWQWSVDDLDGFWTAFAAWAGVRWHTPPTAALGSRTMPGAEWFPGATLNYAEHLLDPPCAVDEGAVAVVFDREDGLSRTVSWRELRAAVASVRAYLVECGVGVGDRVAALLPNSPEALIALLATASLGAVWSSCSPDFGARAIADRFTQIEPVVLFAVDGYVYGGKRFDVRPTVSALRELLPSAQHTVLVPYLDPAATLPDSVSWPDVLGREAAPAFTPVPFDAPLWVLYSSGTTGLPKPIVHSQGGILLEHLKQLALHLDLGPGDRFFWFSTTGWMMWNLLVSGLATGATIVLYDGNPAHPAPDALWRLAERERITAFGVSAPFVQASMKAGVRPSALDLTAVRAVGSTGAPLPPRASPGSTTSWATSCCRPSPAGRTSAPPSSAAPRRCRCGRGRSRAACSAPRSSRGRRRARP